MLVSHILAINGALFFSILHDFDLTSTKRRISTGHITHHSGLLQCAPPLRYLYFVCIPPRMTKQSWRPLAFSGRHPILDQVRYACGTNGHLSFTFSSWPPNYTTTSSTYQSPHCKFTIASCFFMHSRLLSCQNRGKVSLMTSIGVFSYDAPRPLHAVCCALSERSGGVHATNV